ncbi:MAG: ATPase domain-containing protein, partial [Terriglobia bacterium]
MPDSLHLPLLEAVLPDGLRFGSNYLVEFEPQSLWYEASLTLTAQALRAGYRSDYHTFTRVPNDVREALTRLGVNIKRFEEDDTFRIWDSYTVQTGLDVAAQIGAASPRERVDLRSVKMADWDKGVADEVRADVPQVELERLHVDENTSVLLQYNSEKEVVEHFRTLTIPYARRLRLAAIHSVVSGIYTENFYRQFESFCDGIIDFRSLEERGKLNHFMRIRVMRGRNHDSRWVRLELLPSGEVRTELETSMSGSPVLTEDSAQNEAGALLLSLDNVELDRFAIVGNYVRFDDRARNSLNELRQRVIRSFNAQDPYPENFLVWGPAGSGKSYLLQQIAKSIKEEAQYFEMNLAQLDESAFRSELDAVKTVRQSVLCFIDEVDSRPDQVWPYETLLPHLEPPEPLPRRTCFVLAGSGGRSLGEMKQIISVRPKGSDLLSRIPKGNEFVVSPLGIGDKILVSMTQLLLSAKEEGHAVREIEKLALYYIAVNPTFTSARQLRSLAAKCAQRI